MTYAATTFVWVTSADFWIGVVILTATYGIFALGIQITQGTTGITNLAQAGFMAIGTYTFGLLVVRLEWAWWQGMLVGVIAAMCSAVLIGLPSLRLRADYFAITTLAFSEIVRYLIDNSRDLTYGSQGLTGYSSAWFAQSLRIEQGLDELGIPTPGFLLPLALVGVAALLLLTVVAWGLTRTPWGRVLRAIREDQDAARALGKNSLIYKLQALALSAALASIAGFLLALNLTLLTPEQFDPVFTIYGYVIVILGGLGSYFGVVFGAFVLMTILEATRYLELPMAADRVAALRFVVVGLLLMLLVAFRPQGIFGKRQEMILHE